MSMSHIIGISTIVVTFIAAAGILADAVIIYGIFRFKRLRTVPNIFLANWALADLLSILLLPTNVLIPMIGGHEYTCLLIHATLILNFAAVLFGILLSIDWCTAVYHHRTSEKIRKRYTFFIGAIWSTVLLFYSLSAGLCISHVHYTFAVILFIIIYVINVLLIIALQCSRILQKFRANPVTYPTLLTVRLTIITVITFSYLLVTINTAIMYFDVYYASYLYFISHIFLVISIISVLVSSAIVLGVLCWLDKDFRLCLFPNQNDLHERFENEVSEIEDNNKNSPPITYENPIAYINHNNIN